MEEIIYRDVERTDYQPMRELINRTWQIHEYIEGKSMLHRILDMYLRECLVSSTFGLVAEVSGSSVGIILGQARREKKIYGQFSHYLSILWSLSTILFTTRENKKNAKEYLKVLRVYRELIANKSHLYDGDVVLLAVDEEYRGYGIGRELMNRLKEYFHSLSLVSVFVYTDTCCNYGFYDSQGFYLEGSEDLVLTLNGEPLDFTVFLYVYDFKEKNSLA